MQMPRIDKCDASECSYNQDNACHAMAITVGEASEPHCDTFVSLETKGGVPDEIGHVGACKSQECQFNQSLECTAEKISVSHKGSDVECMTYKA